MAKQESLFADANEAASAPANSIPARLPRAARPAAAADTIAALESGEEIEAYYAVAEANLGQTVKGDSYIRLVLSDATGTVQANLWNANKEMFASFAVGDVVKVRGAVETYRGKLQLRLTALRPALESEAEPGRFLPVSPVDPEAALAELRRLIAGVGDADYRALLEAFFADSELVEKFRRAPAAKRNHHATLGGLLEHTVSVGKLAETFGAAAPEGFNRDLLLCGALLHDIGKIEELGGGLTFDYTDSGQLLGHLTIGVLMVEKRALLSDLPRLKKELVMHLILSHHGKHEYGSPVLPKTPEALALHHLDNLDAKTEAALRLIAEDRDPERHWTEKSWMLETSLFKGGMKENSNHV